MDMYQYQEYKNSSVSLFQLKNYLLYVENCTEIQVYADGIVHDVCKTSARHNVLLICGTVEGFKKDK